MREIDVRFRQGDVFDQLEVFIFQRDGEKHWLAAMENGNLMFKPHEEGQSAQATMVFRGQMGRQFMLAIRQELDRLEIRGDADTKALGKIEAMSGHLADLRHLLKLPK